MAEIPSIGHDPVGPITRKAAPAPPARTPGLRSNPLAAGDRVELSDHARLMDRLRNLTGERMDLVSSVRRAIEDGSYQTPEKLDIAVARLLERLRSSG